MPFILIGAGHYRRPALTAPDETTLRELIAEVYAGATLLVPPADAASAPGFERWDGNGRRALSAPVPTPIEHAGLEVTEITASPQAPAVGVSDFAGKRWHSVRGNSRFSGTQLELLQLVQEHWPMRKPGSHRSDLSEVVVVPLPTERFRCDTIPVTADVELHARFSRRQRLEDGFARITGVGAPERARFAAVVLYAKATLCENDGRRSTGADWEVVTVLTSHEATDSPPRMDPLTIARNVLEKPGGTAMPVNGDLARTLVDTLLSSEIRVSLHDPDGDPAPVPLPLESEPPPPSAEALDVLDDYRCATVLLSEETRLAAQWVDGRIEVTAHGPREPARHAAIEKDGSVTLSPIDGREPDPPHRLAEELLVRRDALGREDALRLAESIYHHSLRAPFRDLSREAV